MIPYLCLLSHNRPLGLWQAVQHVKVADRRIAADAGLVVEDGRHDGETQGAAERKRDGHERDDGRDAVAEDADDV